MADHDEPAREGGGEDDPGFAEQDHHEDHHTDLGGRTTAPQSPYTTRQMGIGLAITLAGIFLVFVVPILLA